MPSQTLTNSEEYELAVDPNLGLGQLFYNQMKRSPTSTAVIDSDKRLTYHELHSNALRIAHYLRQEKINFEEPVGIVVQHGIADVVAQMAIIYAGGSCAPMDPTLPDTLIQSRLKKLHARYILVDETNKDRSLGFRHFDVSSETPWKTKELWFSNSELPFATTLEHRTHLIHTSGTTSEPKAVQIAARSILQVVYHAPFEAVDETDIVAHVNNTSFDVALFDIWAPLLRGACIAVLSKVTLLDLPAMAAAINRIGITIMATTTALLNLASTTYPRAFAQLKTCFIGGEAANVAALQIILSQGPPGQLINAYGPTECCIFCLAHKITLNDILAGTVSIGKPIGKTVARICDEDENPVSDGEEGELWIGGAGVSPGYVDQLEKNAACFTTVEEAGQIQQFYRTGDRVRRRIFDGQIDYLGRQDHQVKVRGYRIELEAVEAALLRTGQFSEAVAMKVEAGEGAGSILVAFAVSASSKPYAILKAVESLKEMLPEYMVPQIELISQMPLNSHAKVDRKQLSQLYRQRWSNHSTFNAHPGIAMATATITTQEKLASLWRDILGLPSVPTDADSDFFHLGATSLQASLLISRVQKCFNARVSLLTLYDNSTLKKLTDVLENASGNGANCETVRHEQSIWVEDTKVADDLVPPTGTVTDWRRDTEGRVFFTGATGFVGAFMVADLLRMREVHQVGCLVRASNAETGLQRIKSAMMKYGQWEERFADKIMVLCGSLEDIYLGLGPERFHEIAKWASVIFHLGARVNYTQPYSLHRPANVIGTRNILRLACAGRNKALHYVSSISCFGPTGFVTGTQTITEDEPLLKHVVALPYDHGYAQSQWVVEGLLRRAMDRNFPVAIYRPGFITGHSRTGACNPDDFFCRLIHSCAEMGYYPLLPNQRKEFVPVDYVNATILHIAGLPAGSSLGHAYHIVPPSRAVSVDMNHTMELVGAASGGSGGVKGIPYSEWVELLGEKLPGRLQPLQPMLAEKAHGALTRWELYENMPLYDTTNTARALETYAGGLRFPILDRTLMEKYIRCLHASGSISV
ncbi:uncharacterized protein N7529_011080 [Penicillium soppii]|uniref:uncharacterized protein n=1 Tax=Penicillium soppii TaxID=69789 RepID=UPI00254996ED|nr:uncharacterized protein N7529_011080 [Penicillium soppii]KAJ5851695.1 hypothetical protein N7529_011080 [Penicillium soppii]